MKKSVKVILGICVVGVLACGGLLTVGMQTVDFLQVSPRAEAVAKEYQAAGLPWRAEDLAMNLAPEDNGADLYTSAMTLNKGFSKQTDEIRACIKANDWEGVARVLERNKEVLSLYVEASRKTGLDFDRDWDLGPSLLFPEFAYIKSATRMLSARAELKARNGDLAGALDDCEAGFRLARMMGEEPTLIGMLVGVASEKIMIDGALYVAAVRKDDAEWVGQVRKMVEGWKSNTDFLLAMRGESYMAIVTIRRFFNGPWKIDRNIPLGDDSNYDIPVVTSPSSVDRNGIPTSVINRAYLVRSLKAYLEFDRIAKEKPGNAAHLSDAMEDYVIQNIEGQRKWSYGLNQILFPVFSQAGYAQLRAHFAPAAAVGVLRAGEIKARTGSYPKGLDEVAAGLKDPLTGDAPKYLVKDGAAMIYIFGPNKEDEGGFKESGIRMAGDDFAIQFPPMPRK